MIAMEKKIIMKFSSRGGCPYPPLKSIKSTTLNCEWSIVKDPYAPFNLDSCFFKKPK